MYNYLSDQYSHLCVDITRPWSSVVYLLVSKIYVNVCSTYVKITTGKRHVLTSHKTSRLKYLNPPSNLLRQFPCSGFIKMIDLTKISGTNCGNFVSHSLPTEIHIVSDQVETRTVLSQFVFYNCRRVRSIHIFVLTIIISGIWLHMTIFTRFLGVIKPKISTFFMHPLIFYEFARKFTGSKNVAWPHQNEW